MSSVNVGFVSFNGCDKEDNDQSLLMEDIKSKAHLNKMYQISYKDTILSKSEIGEEKYNEIYCFLLNNRKKMAIEKYMDSLRAKRVDEESCKAIHGKINEYKSNILLMELLEDNIEHGYLLNILDEGVSKECKKVEEKIKAMKALKENNILADKSKKPFIEIILDCDSPSAAADTLIFLLKKIEDSNKDNKGFLSYEDFATIVKHGSMYHASSIFSQFISEGLDLKYFKDVVSGNSPQENFKVLVFLKKNNIDPDFYQLVFSSAAPRVTAEVISIFKKNNLEINNACINKHFIKILKRFSPDFGYSYFIPLKAAEAFCEVYLSTQSLTERVVKNSKLDPAKINDKVKRGIADSLLDKVITHKYPDQAGEALKVLLDNNINEVDINYIYYALSKNSPEITASSVRFLKVAKMLGNEQYDKYVNLALNSENSDERAEVMYLLKKANKLDDHHFDIAMKHDDPVGWAKAIFALSKLDDFDRKDKKLFLSLVNNHSRPKKMAEAISGLKKVYKKTQEGKLSINSVKLLEIIFSYDIPDTLSYSLIALFEGGYFNPEKNCFQNRSGDVEKRAEGDLLKAFAKLSRANMLNGVVVPKAEIDYIWNSVFESINPLQCVDEIKSMFSRKKIISFMRNNKFTKEDLLRAGLEQEFIDQINDIQNGEKSDYISIKYTSGNVGFYCYDYIKNWVASQGSDEDQIVKSIFVYDDLRNILAVTSSLSIGALFGNQYQLNSVLANDRDGQHVIEQRVKEEKVIGRTVSKKVKNEKLCKEVLDSNPSFLNLMKIIDETLIHELSKNELKIFKNDRKIIEKILEYTVKDIDKKQELEEKLEAIEDNIMCFEKNYDIEHPIYGRVIERLRDIKKNIVGQIEDRELKNKARERWFTINEQKEFS